MNGVRKLSLREELLLDIRIFECYHHRRRAFLEGFDLVSKAISILGGSVAFSKLFGSNDTAVAIAGTAVVLFSTVNLVFGTGKAALRHQELERRLIDLERAILKVPEENFTQLNAEKFSDDLLALTADETTHLRVLYALCYNMVYRAEGFGEKHYLKLKWYHYLFAHVVDILPSRISSPTVGASDFPAKIS